MIDCPSDRLLILRIQMYCICLDRKAIITMGQLRCAGRSLFLKTRFGLGYTLTYHSFIKIPFKLCEVQIFIDACRMDLESGENRQETRIIEIVKQFIPNALYQVTPNQLLFTLPLSETDKFHCTRIFTSVLVTCVNTSALIQVLFALQVYTGKYTRMCTRTL